MVEHMTTGHTRSNRGAPVEAAAQFLKKNPDCVCGARATFIGTSPNTGRRVSLCQAHAPCGGGNRLERMAARLASVR